MNKYEYILTGTIILIVVLMTLGLIHYRNKSIDLEAKLQSIPTQQNLAIGKGTTSIADTKAEVKQLDPAIQKDVADTKGKVDVVGKVQASNNTSGGGKLIIVPPGNDGLLPLKLGPIAMPSKYPMQFNYHDFRLDFNGDLKTGDAKYLLHQKFEVDYAESKLPNNTYNSYAELYELDPFGKKVNKLEITSFNITHANPVEQPKFRFWDPHFDIGVHYLITQGFRFNPNIDVGFSFASYGTSNDLHFRFARVGLGANRDGINLNLSPVLYNLASPIPVINNLWLTPTVGYTFDTKSYNLGLGVSVIF